MESIPPRCDEIVSSYSFNSNGIEFDSVCHSGKKEKFATAFRFLTIFLNVLYSCFRKNDCIIKIVN